MKTVDTVLFDLDGTLIDTNELIIASFEHTLGEYYPGHYKRADILPFIGPSLDETFTRLNPSLANDMIEMYIEHNHLHHDQLLREYEGVREAVAQLFDKGYKLGVVTTKRRPTTERGLEITGLKPYFSTIVTFDDVENVKPHPEPIKKAMAQLGSTPEQTIMVGDNTHDIDGGKRAGTQTAAVGWAVRGLEEVRSLYPDYILEDMRDLLHIVGAD
ncbi:pyrophosphatase PpaX [Geomicrobium sediminis]|uniref:Pyrophosphatase PpaX n=1 Tax=Geomicrobium sediminis TaxID=1347788 RepID=A0ABS2P758_9BACL|nr:pyrophosphatase PpaX [Geomicrobium sediminis]MBM7631249.1 pyrophosphatase PpaX [Geomicrobium sediminis]